MRRSTFKKMVIGGGATLLVLAGVCGAWATAASSGEPGKPAGPPAGVPALAPGERAREITKPGEGVPEARWHNCEVVKTKKPVRRFVVDKPDGTKEERAHAQPSVRVHANGTTTPLGPARHDVDCVPTEEQVRELHRLAGVDPDTGMPIPQQT